MERGLDDEVLLVHALLPAGVEGDVGPEEPRAVRHGDGRRAELDGFDRETLGDVADPLVFHAGVLLDEPEPDSGGLEGLCDRLDHGGNVGEEAGPLVLHALPLGGDGSEALAR